MKCPTCQFENADNQKFCGQCGARLDKTCPHCGRPNPPEYRFCGHCSQPLKQEPEEQRGPEVEGERKHVTVLFSDISGFTSLSEKLDPEDVKEIMGRIFGEFAHIVAGYEGFVEKYVGDAVMAIFGAPKAHEDDPARAVRAAIDMHHFLRSISPEIEEATARPLEMHTGINTGLVVIGEMNLKKGTHGALGDTINLAARLMSLAKPGEIVIGRNTYRQVTDLVKVDKMAPLRVKGKSEEIQAYRVVGLGSGLLKGRPAQEKGISPMIGRDAEASVLHCSLEGLVSGRGSIVSIIGEAGIGKSRLIEECCHYSKRHADLCRIEWLQGNTLSYSQTISYWSFIEILRTCAGITEEDDETTAWKLLETRLVRMFGDEVEELLPYIASLMNLTPHAHYGERTRFLDAEAMGRQVLRALYRFFEALSVSAPIVMVFEDLQWMDESSGALLEHIMPLVRKRAILIVVLYRPDVGAAAERLRHVIEEKFTDVHQEIHLARLRRSDSLKMLENLLSIQHLSFLGLDQVIEKSEGNPLFIEEVIRSLINRGDIAMSPVTGRWKPFDRITVDNIPDTLQGLITARIDRLDQGAKTVARLASVIGRSFLYRLLKAIQMLETGLDKALGSLQSVEIIREKTQTPELEYMFTHALVQQAAYEGILLKRRWQLHREVGYAIETIFDNRLEAFYGLLAYHFAKGEDWEKAHEYLMKAGDQAGKIAADAEALIHYQKAIAAYESAFGDNWETLQRVSLERKIAEALYRRGEMATALEHLHRSLDFLGKPMKTSRWSVRSGIAGAIVRHVFRSMLTWARHMPSSAAVAPEVEEEDRIYVALAWVYAYLHHEKFMYTVLRRLNAAERARYPYGIATVSTGMGFICDFFSLPEIAHRYHCRSLTASEKIENPEALGLACFGMVYYGHLQGNWAMAMEQGQRGADAYRSAGDLRGWAECITYGIIFSLISRGETEKAIPYCDELMQVGNEGDDPAILARGLHSHGLIQMRMGSYEEAIVCLQRGLELSETIPDYMARAELGALLGQCYLNGEDLEKALEILEESERLNRERRIPVLLSHLMHALTAVYLALAERDTGNEADWMQKAGATCQQALKAGRGAKAKLPWALLLQGRYLCLKGKSKSARKRWLRAETLAVELDMPYERELIQREIGTRLTNRKHL